MKELWINFIYSTNWKEIGIAFGIFIGIWLFRKILTKYIFSYILKLTSRTKTDIDGKILLAFEKPLRLFFGFLAIYLSLSYLTFTIPFQETLSNLFRSIIITLLAWGCYNLSDTSSVLFEKIGKSIGVEIDKILFPFLSKVLRFVILVFAFTIIAQVWEYEVGGVIAGLGLGGLAFALAAQPTLSNFFGGIVIVTEKPFSIGDWVKTPSVEGTVEDINFRSTKVRTFAQALVTVPNATMSNETITNWSKMGKRRITFNLGVTYSTPKEKLEAVVRRIDQHLRSREDIHQETIFVRFNEFNDSSLDIYLYFFTNTTVWGEWLAIKEDVNFKILEILEKEGVEVAFPSRTLYIEK